MNNCERNANMELLRIISMFMVLVLHSLWLSGALDYLSGPHFFAYWIPESLSMVAVDVFVLLTGFFMVTGRIKLEKIAKLGGVIWSFTLLFSLIPILLTHEADSTTILKMLFPILTKKYWFVNSYLFLFLFTPFLNKLIHSLSKNQFSSLVILLLLTMSVRTTLLPKKWAQDGSGGMSAFFFVVLYCLGAWLRLYYKPNKLRATHFGLGYLLLSVAQVFIKYVFTAAGIPADTAGRFLCYDSILVVAQALLIFLFFLYRKPLPERVSSYILRISKHSFAVYIIHFSMNSVLWTRILHLDHLVDRPYLAIPALLLACLAVFIFCIGADVIRSLIARPICQAFNKTGFAKKLRFLSERYNVLVNP